MPHSEVSEAKHALPPVQQGHGLLESPGFLSRWEQPELASENLVSKLPCDA